MSEQPSEAAGAEPVNPERREALDEIAANLDGLSDKDVRIMAREIRSLAYEPPDAEPQTVPEFIERLRDMDQRWSGGPGSDQDVRAIVKALEALSPDEQEQFMQGHRLLVYGSSDLDEKVVTEWRGGMDGRIFGSFDVLQVEISTFGFGGNYEHIYDVTLVGHHGTFAAVHAAIHRAIEELNDEPNRDGESGEIKAGQTVYAIADEWKKPDEIPAEMIVVKHDGAGHVLCVDPAAMVRVGGIEFAFIDTDDELHTAVEERRAALRIERREIGRNVFLSEREATRYAVAQREREQLEESAAAQ